MSTKVLEVEDLRVSYGDSAALHGVGFTVDAGEIVAVVGESGSGKSTIGRALIGLLPPTARVDGSVRLEGQELLPYDAARMTALRGARLGLVPQDPMTNLNPVRRVGRQIQEALIVHGVRDRQERHERMMNALAGAGLTDAERVARCYPHELSGGMRQRVLIAMALVGSPRLLVADEPTSALDVTVQRHILDTLTLRARELDAAVLLITHDLALAAERADRIMVVKDGDIVENGSASEVYHRPSHPYSQRLLAAAPTRTSPLLIEVDDKPAPVLLQIDGVNKTFHLGRGRTHQACDDVTFSLGAGRSLGVVGESGSGKTTVSRMVLRLTDADSGAVTFDGVDVRRLRGNALRAYRRRVQPVFQDPYSSLDGTYTVAQIIEEPMRLLTRDSSASRARQVRELLDRVALDDSLGQRRPHELSGGQRQRVAIARALAARPELVVCDEAVSALDVVVQQQILQLLVDLQRDEGLAYLFISHDLAVVRQMCHDVVVMEQGRVVEAGRTVDVFEHPAAAYTRRLIDAIPTVETREDSTSQ